MKRISPKSTYAPCVTKHLVSLFPPQVVRELLERRAHESRIAPQIGRQEGVRVADSGESRLECVFERLGGAGRLRVGVLHTGELEKTFDSGGGHETGTARCRDQLEMPR